METITQSVASQVQAVPAIQVSGDNCLGNSRGRNAIYGAIGGLITAGSLALQSDLSNRDVLVNMAVGAVAGGSVGALIKDQHLQGSVGAAYVITAGAGTALLLTRPLIMGLNKAIGAFNTEEVNDESFPEVEELPTIE